MELGLACTRFIIFIGKINSKRLCPDIRTYVIILSRNNCSSLQKRELRNFHSYSTNVGSLFSSNIQNPINVNVPKLFGRNSSMSGRRILTETKSSSPRGQSIETKTKNVRAAHGRMQAVTMNSTLTRSISPLACSWHQEVEVVGEHRHCATVSPSSIFSV